jgi:hypothetical protein
VAGFQAFGDTEAAVCEILRDSPRIAAFTGVVVATDLVGFAYPARRLRVARTGGIPTLWMQMDNPEIEIEASAATKGDAYDLAAAARGVVFAARGTFIGFGVALFDVADKTGITWTPDAADPDVARYVVQLSLVTRPG